MIQIDCVIIGGGPAGVSAGIQLMRNGIHFLIIEKAAIGGLIREANLIENYPPYFDGISGEVFADQLISAVNKLNIQVAKENVFSVNYENNAFEVNTDKNTYFCKYLIVASGTVPNKPSFNIAENAADNVFYDINSRHFIEKNIGIIGSGDAAFDYALTLSKNNTVTILNRSKTIKAIRILQNRVFDKKIEYIEQFEVVNIYKDGNALVVVDKHDRAKRFDVVVTAIGRHPNESFLSKELLSSCANNVNIIKIGDISNFRQAAIAVGDGIKAAMFLSDMIKKGGTNIGIN